jgi:glycerol kinase
MAEHVLAIDEGTTGVRAMLFDRASRLVGAAYEELSSSYPKPGWMEQDPLAIWAATRRVVGAALAQAKLQPAGVAGIGVTNQRASTVVWERRGGAPVYPAISWQDSRTAARVEQVLSEGIFLNSMASATKIEWILDHVDDGWRRAAAGELCFGTMDTWLAWQLSGGRLHATDHSNASCTGLYDFILGGWNEQIVSHLRLPQPLLPEIRASSERYTETDPQVFGAAVPLAGMAGDQQAAMFGELGTDHGAVKITFGTSAMADVNIGEFPILSQRGAYPLVLWSLDGQRACCLEGTVVTAGAAVQWLRDGLGIIGRPEESAELAASVPDSAGVWAVPAFQGLGTPHMEPGGRAAIGGLSRGTTRAHIARAVLEGIAFRSREVLETLIEDAGVARPEVLRVDGGAAANDFLLQFLADVLGQPVERPETVQASALGAAYLAGIAAGVWSGIDELRDTWRSGGVFTPRGSADERDTRYARWREAVAAARIGALGD